MTKYREILRLTVLGLSQRNIIQSCVFQKNHRENSASCQ